MDTRLDELERRASGFYTHRFELGRGITYIASNEWFCYTPYYCQVLLPIKRLIEVCDIFGIAALERNEEFLRRCIHDLEDPTKVKYKDELSQNISGIRNVFNLIRKDAYELDSSLSSTIKRRLNEAIHCFLEGCYYSTVIMSVSAAESKMSTQMKRVNPEKKEYIDKLTLGQLIQEYLDNEEEYDHCIPGKYKSLLELCNKYRIFSAHPKEEEIRGRVAKSILNLTFEFLTG